MDVDMVKRASLLSTAKEVTLARRFPIVELISFWAVYYAYFHAREAASAIYGNTPCNQTSCQGLTGAAAIAAMALNYYQLRCSAPQVAAGVLLPLLAGRRRSSWALAFVAHVATVTNHCILVLIQGLFLVAHPGDILRNVVILAGIFVIWIDLHAFVILFQGGDQEIYGSA